MSQEKEKAAAGAKPPTAAQKLAAAEAARAEKRERQAEARAAQRLIDLEAVAELETEHGASRVAIIDVPHTPGLPTLVVARCAEEAELKRYRFRLKPEKDGTPGDSVGAAEEMADNCLIYPKDAAVYQRLRAERPGIHAQIGVAAVQLAVGKQAEEGKG